jgi:hypothetical protein
MSHRVRLHRWEDGVLKVLDHFFEEIEHAIEFVEQQDSAHIKVYDATGEVVHAVTNGVVTASYA